MPNITHIIDYKVAAELLAKAGSMEKLAMMPASTIQLLGAEKALFKHLKYGTKPPKYGILFKLPDVTNAPREKKGKIARAYAAKIAIAARADFFTKNVIGEQLKASLDKSLEKIKAAESKPKQHEEFKDGFNKGGDYKRSNFKQDFKGSSKHGSNHGYKPGSNRTRGRFR